MKIKTITCHDVYNVGASLQAFALQEYLRSLGHDVEIIDYKPEYLSRAYSLTAVFNEKYDRPLLRQVYLALKLPGRLRARRSHRKKEFDCFRDRNLNLTRRYTSFEELCADPPKGDVYFAGSDQIWNAFFPNGRDPAFYLDFVPAGSIRASYAASFATEEIPDAYRTKITAWLEKIDYISVRESSGLAILRGLGIQGGIQVMDPVFLLSKEYWESKTKHAEKRVPYLLVYDFDGNPAVKEFAARYAKEHKAEIWSVFPNDYCNRCFSEEGPEMFLGLVMDADFVISNSFHATAFSLIFEKQFAVFARKEAINTRMRDLLTLVGLESRMINSHTDDLPAVDFAGIRNICREMAEQSKRYINAVLENRKHD